MQHNIQKQIGIKLTSTLVVLQKKRLGFLSNCYLIEILSDFK